MRSCFRSRRILVYTHFRVYFTVTKKRRRKRRRRRRRRCRRRRVFMAGEVLARSLLHVRAMWMCIEYENSETSAMRTERPPWQSLLRPCLHRGLLHVHSSPPYAGSHGERSRHVTHRHETRCTYYTFFPGASPPGDGKNLSRCRGTDWIEGGDKFLFC